MWGDGSGGWAAALCLAFALLSVAAYAWHRFGTAREHGSAATARLGPDSAAVRVVSPASLSGATDERVVAVASARVSAALSRARVVQSRVVGSWRIRTLTASAGGTGDASGVRETYRTLHVPDTCARAVLDAIRAHPPLRYAEASRPITFASPATAAAAAVVNGAATDAKADCDSAFSLVIAESKSVGTGGAVWNPSYAVCNLVTGSTAAAAAPRTTDAPAVATTISLAPPYFRGKRVLELGSGMGLLACVLAYCEPAALYQTDSSSGVLALCAANVQLNTPPRSWRVTSYHTLAWGDAAALHRALARGDAAGSDPAVHACAYADVVLGCDILYNPRAYDALWATLCHACAAAARCGRAAVDVVLAYDERQREHETGFFDRFEAHNRRVAAAAVASRSSSEAEAVNGIGGVFAVQRVVVPDDCQPPAPAAATAGDPVPRTHVFCVRWTAPTAAGASASAMLSSSASAAAGSGGGAAAGGANGVHSKRSIG